jgi:hypothetical protein
LYVHIVSDTIVSVILPFAVVYVVLLLPHISALLIQARAEPEIPKTLNPITETLTLTPKP